MARPAQGWRDAAEWFGAVLKANELDDWDVATLDYLACGAVLAEIGDKSYETFREEAIARFKGTDFKLQPSGSSKSACSSLRTAKRLPRWRRWLRLRLVRSQGR